MIYNHDRIFELQGDSTQFRLLIDPHWRHRTMHVRLFQVPLPQKNPGGHLAYLIDSQEVDLPFGRITTLTDVYGVVCEATMQVRLPGLD